jgi:tRNA dimethylallyltransferase
MAEAGKVQRAMGASERPLLIIAGPTASGKSALALELAARWGGSIINADAMQCYRELRVITARPSAADEAAAPHLLYGVRAAAEPAHAAWWRGAALAEMAAAKLPILCGGTGMYLAALLNGIADVPDSGAAARTAARALLAEIGPEKLHARLMAVDPETAAKLKPGDSQRLARAWEVFAGTGRGLAYWQARPTARLAGWDLRMIFLDPPREELSTAIARRFAGMLEAGAVKEVRTLLAQNLDPALPLLRAHGVPEIRAYLREEISLQEAERRAVLATHQYTKRQRTWFRHQKLVADSAMHIIQTGIGSYTQEMRRILPDLDNFINSAG